MDCILEVKNLTKIYKKKENIGIFNLNFFVEKGSFHAFIGENGAGKTTTIKTIIGSYTNWSGEILIDGINALNPESKKKLGYIPENAIFPKDITSFEYLKYLGILNGIDKSLVKNQIEEFLEKFGILDLKDKKPNQFSSGQKKKVLLIQALLSNPEIIILDEPAANLDPTARFQLFTILKELNKEGKSIFISSHILSEIDKYVDSLTLIHEGEIKYCGKKEQELEKIFYEKIIKN